MHDIYSHASQVLISLGLEADNSHKVFEWITDVKSRGLKHFNLTQESLETRQPTLASRYGPAETLEKWQQLSVVDAGMKKAMREFKRECVSGFVVEPIKKLLKNA